MPFRRSFAGVGLLLFTIAGFGLDARLQTVAAGSANASPAAAAGPSAQFTGTYRYAGNAQEEEARKAAIDHAVEGMSFIIRSAARSRVTATTQILGSYGISFEPGKIVVRPQSRPEMISGDKGESADYVYNGKRSKFTQVLAGDRITQVFVSEDGTRQNEYTFSDGGKGMMLKVTLSSPRLTNPVIYTLSYKRAD